MGFEMTESVFVVRSPVAVGEAGWGHPRLVHQNLRETLVDKCRTTELAISYLTIGYHGWRSGFARLMFICKGNPSLTNQLAS